jgi:hypothetical protein
MTLPQGLTDLLPLIKESTVLVFYGLPYPLDFLIAESVQFHKPELLSTLRESQTICLQELAATFASMSTTQLPKTLPLLFTYLTKEQLLDPDDAFAKVAAAEIVHYRLFEEFQSRPDFLSVGRDLVYQSMN